MNWFKRLFNKKIIGCTQCKQQTLPLAEATNLEGKITHYVCPACYTRYCPEGYPYYSPFVELMISAIEQKVIEPIILDGMMSLSLGDYNSLLDLNLKNQLNQ